MFVIEIYKSLHTETNINNVWRNYWETIYGLIELCFQGKGWVSYFTWRKSDIYIFLIRY